MADLKFEESFKKLGKIVEKLEGGELGLDEALKQFEEGVKLARNLNQKIEDARRKVEQLLKSRDGKASRKLLEGGKEDEGDEVDEEDGEEDPDEEDDDQDTLF